MIWTILVFILGYLLGCMTFIKEISILTNENDYLKNSINNLKKKNFIDI